MINELPKRYRKLTTNLYYAKKRILNRQIVVVPYNMWQQLNRLVPTCLRGIYDLRDVGQVVVLHRYQSSH